MIGNGKAATAAFVVLLCASILACAGPSPEPTPTPLPTTSAPVPTLTPVPPTPTPELKEPNYSSDSLALSLWYPETWVHEEMPDAVAFASSATLISSEEWETGAAFAVLLAELESGQTMKELIQELLEQSAFDEVQTSELQPVGIGDQRGVITNLEATPMDSSVDIKGFVAGVEHNRLAYMFMGISVKEDWPEFGDTLEAMLRSVRFSEPAGTYTNQDLGLKIWYPEDWVLQEDYDQVVFATSHDLIDTGNLETGAALMITGSSLGDACLEDWFAEEAASFTFDTGGPTSDISPQNIAGQEGLIFELEGVPTGSDSEIKGFVAALEHEDWGYIFLGVAAVDEWADYAPTLDEMMSSVEFTE
jgi:hypothetical protein